MSSPVPDSGWGVHLFSRGVPQKVYLDLALSMSKLDVNYGPHVSHHIDSFVNSIDRMLPPSSPGPAQVRIGWWDNLRYQIHGNFTIRTEHLSFRWLLDDVDMPHRSMLFKSDATEVGYEKGRFLLKVVGLCGSLPREGYPFLEIRQRRKTTAADRHRSGTTASAYEDARESTYRESYLPAFDEEALDLRHDVILLPYLELKCGLSWLLHSAQGRPHEHHVYAIPPVVGDRLHLYRSAGVRLDISVSVEKTEER